MLNKAMIIGNLTRDPETRTTPAGQNVTTFSVATNFTWTDQAGQKQKKAEFHNIVAWRKLGDICAQYLHKGSKVFIEGRLQTRDWTGQDGVKRYRTEIVGENMIMLDRPGGAAGGYTPAPSEPPIPSEEPSSGSDYSEEEIKVENIPF
jgi:single-strand DNA-binding protein